MNTIPVYKYPAAYARENDELEQYRASYKANVACKDAIETAIRDNYQCEACPAPLRTESR